MTWSPHCRRLPTRFACLASVFMSAVETIGGGRSVSVPVATAEDSIVSRLEWFRLTDETSERQWGDVSRLVDLHGPRLDTEYMQQMADSVGVGDLLQKLLSQR